MFYQFNCFDCPHWIASIYLHVLTETQQRALTDSQHSLISEWKKVLVYGFVPGEETWIPVQKKMCFTQRQELLWSLLFKFGRMEDGLAKGPGFRWKSQWSSDWRWENAMCFGQKPWRQLLCNGLSHGPAPIITMMESCQEHHSSPACSYSLACVYSPQSIHPDLHNGEKKPTLNTFMKEDS